MSGSINSYEPAIELAKLPTDKVAKATYTQNMFSALNDSMPILIALTPGITGKIKLLSEAAQVYFVRVHAIVRH